MMARVSEAGEITDDQLRQDQRATEFPRGRPIVVWIGVGEMVRGGSQPWGHFILQSVGRVGL
jgi:hypothetical protein